MSTPEEVAEKRINNIMERTGKTLPQVKALVKKSGLEKHGEIRDMLVKALGIGPSDANAVVHAVLESDGTRAAKAKGLSGDAVLDEIYVGAKEALRPIHEALMLEINKFGAFEIAPKKGYVSLRRKKQFAMLGPATNTRVELGINVKGLKADARLMEQPAGKMCNYVVRLTEASQVDKAIIAWVKLAYDGAG